MSASFNIPESWLYCTLGEIISYGETVKVEPNEIPSDAWVLELEDIEKDTSKLLQRVSFAQRQSKSTKNKFVEGDVLYGKLRPYLNKVHIADQDGYCSTEIIPLQPNEAIEGRFLFYWLKNPQFLEYAEASSHGLTMPRLSTKAGKQAPLVLAPLNEQKRIADKLDNLLARVDECRGQLSRVKVILHRFRQSVLKAALSGKITEDWHKLDSYADGNPSNWNLINFGELTESSLYGPRFSKKDYVSDGIPTVRTTDISFAGTIDLQDAPRVSASSEEIKKWGLLDGDLLITRTGSIGKCAIYRESSGPALPSAI